MGKPTESVILRQSRRIPVFLPRRLKCRVSHLRDGFIVTKVGILAKLEPFSSHNQNEFGIGHYESH